MSRRQGIVIGFALAIVFVVGFFTGRVSLSGRVDAITTQEDAATSTFTKVVEAVQEPPIGDDAARLLVTASLESNGLIYETEGVSIKTTRKIIATDNPRIYAQGKAALDELKQKGLIAFDSRRQYYTKFTELWRLTDTGYHLAESLADRVKVTLPPDPLAKDTPRDATLEEYISWQESKRIRFCTAVAEELHAKDDAKQIKQILDSFRNEAGNMIQEHRQEVNVAEATRMLTRSVRERLEATDKRMIRDKK